MERCKTILFYMTGEVKVGARTTEIRFTRFRMSTPNLCNNYLYSKCRRVS